jgi:hypothetical protein
MRHGYTILLDYPSPVGNRTMTLAVRHYDTPAIRDAVQESELEILSRKYPPNSLRVATWEIPQ